MATLEVYYNDVPCARLSETGDGRLQFRYLGSWREAGHPAVSLALPLTKTVLEHAAVAPFVAAFR